MDIVQLKKQKPLTLTNFAENWVTAELNLVAMSAAKQSEVLRSTINKGTAKKMLLNTQVTNDMWLRLM